MSALDQPVDTTLGKNNKILDIYLKYHSTYTTKYGEKTAVLCQVGDFFEIYAIISETEQRGPNIYKLAEILGIQVTRRDKSKLEVNETNYLMSGFPLPGIQKHIQTLLSQCYTVVVVRQTTPPPNVKREVTEIISPSMTLTPMSSDANYILVLAFQCTNATINTKPLWSCGMAAADISTGSSMIYEVSSTAEDPSYALDEVVRILHTYPAKEIVLLSLSTSYASSLDDITKTMLMDTLGISHRLLGIHPIWEKYPTAFNKREYQEAILSKADIGKGILSNHIMSGMDDIPLASFSFSYLIQFAYEHNPKSIQHLQAPQRLFQNRRLTLQYNSAIQLNMIGTGMPNETPLLAILNRTLTSFGTRLFRERLLHPITDTNLLEQRYDEITYYLQDNLFEKVRKYLPSILDLERIARRMNAETYHPSEWPSFYTSLLSGKTIADLLNKTELSETIQNVILGYIHVLDLEEASKYNLNDIRGNIFQHGIDEELDQLQDIIQENIKILANIAKKITDYGGDTTLCKVDCNERDGYFLSITKKRWDAVKANVHMSGEEYHTKPISSISNTLRVTSKVIDSASDMIITSQSKISAITQQKYLQFMREFIETYSLTIQNIATQLGNIDVQTTNALNAHEYQYTRPVFIDKIYEKNTDEHHTTSFLDAKALRHPIIERIQQKVNYVANDVRLRSEQSGLLLYGVNSSGKSSLMKAIGLAVIMAQSGMYVPCSEFTYTPFRNIFTRISGNDNIYQGLSSFAVEMTELKHILIRADDRSLILGDELCAGTEAVSALAIVASGIDLLLKKRALFVFATHLHDLLQIPDIAAHIDQSALQVAHMHTEVQDGSIVYDRTLRAGSGADTYGIEVCRGLGMPSEFMTMAERVRKFVRQEDTSFVSAKSSRYNASVTMDLCGVCKTRKATETHHIKYQQNAMPDGFIKDAYIHKNHASNLVPLCHTCHIQEHHGSLLIRGWKHTSTGVTLDYIFVDDLDKPEKEEENKTPISELLHQSIEEFIVVWKPYLRYTRKGWMMRKTTSHKSKFKLIPEEKLIEEMKKNTNVSSYLMPTLSELEQMQTSLLDVSL